MQLLVTNQALTPERPICETVPSTDVSHQTMTGCAPFAPSIQQRLSCHRALLSWDSPEGGGILGVRSPALLPGRSYGKCRLNTVR